VRTSNRNGPQIAGLLAEIKPDSRITLEISGRMETRRGARACGARSPLFGVVAVVSAKFGQAA
jgi:hypothetical protein